MTRKRSGLHVRERRRIGASSDEWRLMDAAAGFAGLSWRDWARLHLLRVAGRAAIDRRRAGTTERASQKRKG